jgi:uncharacterized protein
VNDQDSTYCTAFEGSRCIASGELFNVARMVKNVIDKDEKASVLIFDDWTSELVEVDFRGTVEDVLKRIENRKQMDTPAENPTSGERRMPRSPGRPRLGVVSREVTLLPRHWDWLNSQPGGASVALRKLVEEARRANIGKDRVRHSQESAYRFMSAMAGNLPGFEEAARALFAGDRRRFEDLTTSWPGDIRSHSLKLSDAAFGKYSDGVSG